jgi:hypothetical protein
MFIVAGMTIQWCLMIFAAGLAVLPLAAQDKTNSASPVPGAAATPLSAEAARVHLLREALKRREEARLELEAERAKFRQIVSPTPEERQAFEEKEERFEALSRELNRGLSGVADPVNIPDKGGTGLQAQFEEVVKPALEIVNDMMKHPREMSDLRRGIEQLEKEIAVLDKAIAGLAKTAEEVDAEPDTAANAALLAELKRQEQAWRETRSVKESQRVVFENRLNQLRSERQGFGQYAAKLWSGFVLQTMLHLLLALTAFGAVLFVLRWVRKWLARRGLRRRMGASAFVARACDLLFHFITLVAATASAFVVLWICGDWLLLTLAMLMVAGLVLLGRYTLPKMMDQARIILNLGGLREGERVLWNGLPWLVKRLHFSSVFQNPALTGGTVRLPIRSVGELLSREFGSKERWFPTDEGDWVELSDGTVGRVVLQTVETVQLVLVGGSFKNYLTKDFLAKTPRNLSHNFRVISEFGLDFRHLGEVTGSIPEVLALALRLGYRRLLPEDQILRVNVELEEVGDSALKLAVLADFTGEAAPQYKALHRLTQQICVETAVEHGWNIPFPQLVVHREGEVAP